jgi:hypothetical protein
MRFQKHRSLSVFTLFFIVARNRRGEGALTADEGDTKRPRRLRMSRNRLLLAVAAAALMIAGTSGGFAQQEPNAGKEKSAPSTLSKPGTGAVQQQGGRVGQSDHREIGGPSDRSKTTGQAPSVTDKAGDLKAGEKAIEKKAGSAQNQTEKGIRGDRERSTTGQAGQGERRDNVERDRTQTDRVQGGRNEGRATTEGGREGRSSTNVTVELSPEQRDHQGA